MKILLISSDDSLTDEITPVLKALDSKPTVTSLRGGVDGISNLDSENLPDIIILDCSQMDNSQLDSLETLVPQYRDIAFILLRNIVTHEFLIYSIRIGAKDVLPLPISHGDLVQAVVRIGEMSVTSISHVKEAKIIAFIGAKGGVGSTFIASNFAYIVAAQHNKKVALLDLDLQFGDSLLYLSDNPPLNTLSDLVSDISRLDGSLLESSMVNVIPNLAVLPAPEDAEQSGTIKSDHIDALLKIAKGQNDYVVLDIGRTINSISVKALDYSDHIFIVTQTTLPCIRATKRLVSTFMSLGYSKEKVNLIINRYDKNSQIKVKDVELTSGIKVFEMIPNSYECVSASVNQGIPVMNISKNNPVTNALYELVKKLVAGSKVQNASWLTSFIHRLWHFGN